MNIEKALQILSKDIEEIENILSGIEKFSLPDDLEMELAISKLKNLKENFDTLGHSLHKELESLTSLKAKSFSTPPEKVSSPSPVKEPPAPPGMEQPASPVPEKKEEPAPPSPEEKPSGKEEAPSVKKEDKKEKTVFLSDKLGKKQTFRNERLGQAHPKDVSSSIKSRPLSDLHKAIGLNEKFMFIRDLFGGDNKKYEETVRFINNSVSREEIEKFISKFNWDKKKESVREFMDLVERKLKSLTNG